MARQLEDHMALRKYLLGEDISDDSRRQMEERLLLDEEFYEELLLAEDDLVDEYVSGALTPAARERFEQHFLTTVERRRKLRFAQALRKYVAAATAKAIPSMSGKEEIPVPVRQKRFTNTWRRWFFNSYAIAAVSAVLACFVVFGIWRGVFFQSDVNKGLLALKTAYRDRRPVEARISGFDYAPLLQTREPESTRVGATARAERILLDAVSDDPGPAARHALGRLYLSERKFEQAVALFEEALRDAPANAQLHNDLGAALLELGKGERSGDEPDKSLRTLARGLDHLNKALELNNSLPEALFNRALTYEAMILPRQAAEDWRQYLAQDPKSQWAAEAARHLRLLEEQQRQTPRSGVQVLPDFLRASRSRDDKAAWRMISQQRDLAGSLVINALLDQYLESAGGDQTTEDREMLNALSYGGEIETAKTGDNFISDLARFYQSTTPAQRLTLAEARRLLKQGHGHLQQSRPEKASELYSQARRLFQRAGDDPEALYALYPLGHASLSQLKSTDSLSVFEELARACETAGYRWLLAQTLNAIANAQIGLNNYSLALENSARSLRLSEEIGDTNGVLKTKNQMAQEYLYLGNYDEALSLHRQILEATLTHSPEPMQRWRSYFTIAFPLHLLGLSSAAVEYQKEALRLAEEMKMPLLIARSYINLGLMYGGGRDFEAAITNVRRAFELARSLPSESARKETTAYSSLQLGHLYRQAGDAGQALSSYEQASRLYDELKFPAFNYVAHKGKLLSCLALDGCATAEQEIETTFKLFEQHRAQILEEGNRNSFFDTEQNICDVATDFAYARKGDARAAFEFAERCRARSLLDLTHAGAQGTTGTAADIRYSAVSHPLPLAELQARLPERAQLLQFVVLDERLLIFFITKTQFASYEQQIGRQDLSERVSRFLQAISTPSDEREEEARQVGRELYEILIQPAASMLDGRRGLCIIPDKILSYLPYGALISPEQGRYLIEQTALLFAPSANVFLVCSETARQKEPAKPEHLLSVGNPRFSRRMFPALGDLPAARREAEEIATYYPTAHCLTEGRATPLHVENELRRADVVHIAAHAVADERSPLRSKLLLAAGTGAGQSTRNSEGVLSALDIYRLRLPITRLVVLSACRTAAERYYGGEGMISFSRSFIAAGVPLVVASLWPVDSEATADLMISFHRRRREQLPSVESLRRAQLEMLNGAEQRFRHPYYWAPFIAVGGNAGF